MNNNINGNYNLNQSNYTTVTEAQHTNALQVIKQRRAEIVYQIEQQEYAEAAEKKSITALTNWAESKDF
jgi:hypothetical protein